MTIDIQNVLTNTGELLTDINREKPVILVFLRHFGCIFCREALDDLAEKKVEIDNNGIELILVHMAANELAEQFLKEYDLSGVKHISDPECELYARFGLTKGRFTQLFGVKTLLRAFELKRKSDQLIVDPIGDSFQMPGVFLLKNDRIVDSYIHKTISDRPDYDTMIQHYGADSQ